MKRLILLAVVAGCQFETSSAPTPEPPVAVEAVEAETVEVPDSIDAAVSSTSPPVAGSTRVPGLAVTIGAEVLRLDAQAVRAVSRDTLEYLGPSLIVSLDDEAGERFAAMTGAHVGKQAVVTLDGSVLMTLSVQSRIATGRLAISIPDAAPPDLEARLRAATGT